MDRSARRRDPEHMAVGIELQRVRRTTGGRIHLTPHVPQSGPVVTLCNQELAEGSFRTTDEPADCRNCVRRQDDPAVVSSAFFRSEVGAELLQRSLEQAQLRQKTAPAPPSPEPHKPVRATPPAPPPPPRDQVPEAIAELRSRVALRKTFENVFTSPQGVIIRVSKDGRVDHVTFDGPLDLRRRKGVINLRVGDVVLDLDIT